MLRIFSKNNDLSYNDYVKNIKGKTILSNLKTNYSNSRTIKTNNNKIVSYLSYNDFLIITQTFYKFSNLKKNYKPPQKIIDLKTSFIFYNKILNHIQNCSFCKTNSIEIFFENCKEIKNILYPYGEYFTYEIYSNLASVDLDYWCKKECIHNYCDNKLNENFDTHCNFSDSVKQSIDTHVMNTIPINSNSDTNSTSKNDKINLQSMYLNNETKLFKIKYNDNRIEFVSNSLTIQKNTFNIFIAELSNSKEYIFDDKICNDFETEYKHYNIYNFIPIYINFDEFKKVFYHSSTKYFNISDTISEKIKLSNQHFKNINNKIESFLIAKSIKKIFIEKNNYNEMDANTLIEIEKETNSYFSLYDFNYIKNSLSLEEFIHIINSNNIQVDSEIKVKIKVYYNSEKTGLPCIMYFNYILQNL